MKKILILIAAWCAVFSANAQCLYLPNCPTQQAVCDITSNDADLWNKPYWWDLKNQTQDLSDAPVSQSILAVDSCAGSIISAQYLLFLDLDSDGSAETVIKSWAPPAAGTVNFGNINNPNYDGGEVRIFDERPVPADQKYQFGLETTAIGDSLTAKLRWSTPAFPNVSIDPLLPISTAHKIRWEFSDNLGNSQTCEYFIPISDCKKPVLVCMNGIVANLMPTQQITLWASDFLQYAEDNATPANLLVYSIRKLGTGTGFPTDNNGDPIASVTFDCAELGEKHIELWAKDASGNADFCITSVSIEDPFNNCGGGGNPEAPVIVCHNGFTIHLQANGEAEISAAYLTQLASDNNTPSNQLDLGIRLLGAGAGFPLDGQGDPIESIILDSNSLGIVALEIWVRDEDGNTSFCETTINLAGYIPNTGIAPTVVCLNGISVNIMPTGVIQMWAVDFLQYAEDDVTPSNQITIAVRKAGTGTGFPEDAQGNPITSVTYSCNELGLNTIELWAMDEDGNVSYCESPVWVQDIFGTCANAAIVNQYICVRQWCDHAPIKIPVFVQNQYPNLTVSVVQDTFSSLIGCYHVQSSIPIPNYEYLEPYKNEEPLNGVTPLDLVKISRHILGIAPFSNPYSMIAADATRSNSITTSDIISLRRLLLGFDNELPNNNSWRFFFDGSITNPANPFIGTFGFNLDSLIQSMGDTLSFIGIKVGDVDCDANPGVAAPADERSVQFFNMPDAMLSAGESIEIPVSMAENGAWLAFKAGFEYDAQQVEIEGITPKNLAGLDEECFAKPELGKMNLIWFNQEAQRISANSPIIGLRLRALAPIRLSEVFHLTKAQSVGYDASETAYNLQLRFEGDATSHVSTTHEIWPAQPNPTTGSSKIPIRLTEEDWVSISVFDVAGKALWEQRRLLPAGLHNLEIPEQAIGSSGLYYWKVEAGSVKSVGKLVRRD